MNEILSLWTDDNGQDQAEYGLLLLLVAMVIVVSLGAFSDHIATLFSHARDVISSAG